MALKNKILITVDASQRCLETIRHVTQRKPFQEKHLVLYHVHVTLPDYYWDIEMEPHSRGAVTYVRSWEEAKKNEIEQFLDDSRQMLLEAGFPEERITVQIKESEKGIARDIVQEAKSGYLAVIISRSGTGETPEPFLGSNAAKIIQNLSFVPVFIAGKRLPENKYVMAMDRSEGAMRTVDFVGELVGGYGFPVTLLHVIRVPKSMVSTSHYSPLPKEEIKIEEQEMQAVFDEAKERLIQHGFKKDDISTKIITDASSRSEAIVKEAKDNDYATIIIGRRGLSKVQEFFMGSVSNKVIQQSIEQAVWVVT